MSAIEDKSYQKATEYLSLYKVNALQHSRREAEYLYYSGKVLESRNKLDLALEDYLAAFKIGEEIKDNKLILLVSESLINILAQKEELSPQIEEIHLKTIEASNRLNEKNKLDEIFKRSFAEMDKDHQLLESELSYTNKVLFFSLSIILMLGLVWLLSYQNNKKNKLLALKNKELIDNEVKYRTMRNNLFANISHEFRTPLTILKTALIDMQKEDFEGSYESYARMLLRNTENLADLTEQMLDLAKMSENNLILIPVKIDLNHFLHSLLEQLSALVDHKSIKLFLEVPKTALEIDIDINALTKIVQNLVYNAIKFTPEHGRIEVKVKVKTECWELLVIDSGVGMSKEKLAHIFNRYFQDFMDRNRGETGGLGLALTKQLIELQQGTISVNSEPRKRTTFVVNLPHQIPDLQSEQYDIQIRTQISMFLFANNKTRTEESGKNLAEHTKTNLPIVMIIEDSPDLNFLLYNKLKNDYLIYRAYNGKEAYTQLENGKILPDLILTDLMMPEMSGFEFVEQLFFNVNYSHIPLIVVSALDKDVGDMKLWKNGIIDFVKKPFDINILKYKINNLLKSRQEFRAKLFKENWMVVLEEPSLSSLDKEFLNNLINYIEKYLDKELNVLNMSKAMAMSRASLYNKIKGLTNHSPTMFLRKYRLTKAKELLELKVGNVSEIANKVGYYNASQFSTVFKEEFGVTPSSILKGGANGLGMTVSTMSTEC